MQRSRVSTGTPSIAAIAIGGRELNDVQTRVESGSATQSVTHRSAPVEQHALVQDGQGVTITLPALTALQLYHDGTLTADPGRAVAIAYAGRPLGEHYLHSMRALAGNDLGSHVSLRFGRQPGKPLQPHDPSAWLKDLTPLQLHARGPWDPEEEYWGEEGEPVEPWAQAVIKRGIRSQFEMEQVLPGADPDEFESDPILQANALKDRGQKARAKKLLERLLVQDVRCLDAHAHLGNLAFESDVRTALDHYQRGVLIGQLSVGPAFDEVLPWGLIDNRPFLRCLNGFGLCLWRLGRFEEAETVFERLLWICPSDNLGVRMLLPQVQSRTAWSVTP
jgi:hypothetical protein